MGKAENALKNRIDGMPVSFIFNFQKNTAVPREKCNMPDSKKFTKGTPDIILQYPHKYISIPSF
jgi:hypothetical protein